MSSDLPLQIKRANSSALNGKLSPWECRTGFPKKCLNQSASRLISGNLAPTTHNAIIAESFRRAHEICNLIAIDFADAVFAVLHCSRVVRFWSGSMADRPACRAVRVTAAPVDNLTGRDAGG